MNEREIGALLAQIDYLKDVVKVIQNDFTSAMLNRKDVEHSLIDISKGLSKLFEHAEKFEVRFIDLEKKVGDHIVKDEPVETVLATKIGKWIIAAIAGVCGWIVLTLFQKYIKI